MAKNDIKNVFISHVNEDDETLQGLKSLLKDSGYQVRDASIDSSKPNAARDEAYIKNEILAPRIRWASALVVLISPRTHDSRWVDWEIECAQEEGKRIVGVYAQGGTESDLPKAFELYGDALVGWQADRVMDAINGKVSNWTRADGSERPAREIDHHNC